MLPPWNLALVLSLAAPIAPVPQAPSKIAAPTTTTGGASAEASDDTRTTPPAELDTAVRDVLARLGEDPEVTPTEQEQLDAIVGALRADDPKKARALWKKLVAAHRTRTGAIDVGALVQWVLRQSYLEANEDLKHFAAKVAAFNAAKKELREHLERVRAEVAAKSPATASFAMATVVVCKRCKPGKKMVAPGGSKVLTAAQWNAYAAELESRLQTLGDDAQLANVELQDVLQKQQQTVQMMSNISKQMHDTANSIVRKMRG